MDLRDQKTAPLTPKPFIYNRRSYSQAGRRRVRVPNCATAVRLNRAFSRLQDIQLVRNHRQDPFFGKSAEERFIWRELLDLELQDVDEQNRADIHHWGNKLGLARRFAGPRSGAMVGCRLDRVKPVCGPRNKV